MRKILLACALLAVWASPAFAQVPIVVSAAPTITTALSAIDGHVDGLEAAAINNLPTVSTLANGMSIPLTTLIGMVPMCKDAGSTVSFCNFGTDANHGTDVIANGPEIQAEATASVVGDTNVGDGKSTRPKAGLDGVLLTRPYANREDVLQPASVAITDGSSTVVIGTGLLGSGIRAVVTDAQCSNSSSTNVEVYLRDGVAGTILATIPCPANAGAVVVFPMGKAGTANTGIYADPSASASSITITLGGFKSKL